MPIVLFISSYSSELRDFTTSIQAIQMPNPAASSPNPAGSDATPHWCGAEITVESTHGSVRLAWRLNHYNRLVFFDTKPISPLWLVEKPTYPFLHPPGRSSNLLSSSNFPHNLHINIRPPYSINIRESIRAILASHSQRERERAGPRAYRFIHIFLFLRVEGFYYFHTSYPNA